MKMVRVRLKCWGTDFTSGVPATRHCWLPAEEIMPYPFVNNQWFCVVIDAILTSWVVGRCLARG
jgi:hypothetical protein